MGTRGRTTVLLGVGTAALAVTVAVAPWSARAVARPAAATVDRPDTATAALASPSERPNRWLRESLPAGDVDWFHFRPGTVAAVSVTLGGLPADYDLAVFDANGRQLGASTRKGRTFDEVWVHGTTGDLLARVTRKRGAKAGTYALRLRSFSPGLHTLTAQKTTTRGDVIGEFYNAGDRWLAVSELDVQWLDRAGRVVHRDATGMRLAAWIRPWSRVPFFDGDQITGSQDDRTVSFRVTAQLVPQDVPPGERPLTARITRTHTWPTTRTNSGGREYDGVMSTTSRTQVGNVKVYLCEYDWYGTLQVLGLSDDSYTLPPRGRHAWHGDAMGKNWATPALVTVRAYENLGG